MASLTDSQLISRARFRAEEILKKDLNLDSYKKLLQKFSEIPEVFVQD
jgi:hypothetical protein